MRLLTGLAAALCAVLSVVAVVGCDSSAPGPRTAVTGSRAPGPSAAGGQSADPGASPPPASVASSHPAQAGLPGPKTSGGARKTAAQFDQLFFSSQFAASWRLLSSSAKHLIPENLWVKVHEGCSPASSGAAREVASVTIFGDTAIISEKIASGSSGHDADHYLLNYANGRWAYSPDDMNIYHRGSVAADVAAAKAADFCGGLKVF